MNSVIPQTRLDQIANIELSNVDKKTNEKEINVVLCNYVDVYKHWAITKAHKKDFMIATAKKSEIKKFSLKKGQVAITKDSEKRDDIGISAYIADTLQDVVLGYHCALITPNPELLDGSYLNAFFHTNMAKKHFENQASGSGQRYTLTKEGISCIKIPLPKLEYQKTIGRILSSLDRKIFSNNSIISKLEEMAKTIYKYWFLQFDFPNQEGKPYASSGGAMKYSEELERAIPSDWEVRYTNHFCEVQTGSEDANFATPQGKYKFFTCAQESYQCDTPAFEGHAILIAGNGDFNVKHYTGEFNAYQRTYVLLPKKQNYALLYFVVQQRIAHFKKGSNGSIVKFIRKSDVENIPIPYPNDTKILNTLNHFILMKEQKMSENQKLAQLRDWLLPMLMNGQVRVE